ASPCRPRDRAARRRPSTTRPPPGPRTRVPSPDPAPPPIRADRRPGPSRHNPGMTTELQHRCDVLRSLHRPGDPLLLRNGWAVATARAVVAAGFPVVATSSGAVAASLGHEDHEGAPAEEMLAVAARIARSVDVPVTVDGEAGYGMEPAELVAALRN